MVCFLPVGFDCVAGKVCSNEELTLETSATHQTPQGEKHTTSTLVGGERNECASSLVQWDFSNFQCFVLTNVRILL